MDVRMVDAGGVRLACRMSGRPDGHPVVVLHTLGRDGKDWDEVARGLGRRCRIHAPDLRGHGLSERAAEYSFELLRDDLGALVEALGLERVSLVGHGAGGVVAYLYAAKYPERVERLVLEEVPPPLPGGTADEFRSGSDDRPGEGFDPTLAAVLAGQLAEPPEDWRAGLDAIAAPTMLLSGGLRGRVPRDRLVAMARVVRDARLVTIPAGPEIHTMRPVDFAATLTGFLPSASAPGTRRRRA